MHSLRVKRTSLPCHCLHWFCCLTKHRGEMNDKGEEMVESERLWRWETSLRVEPARALGDLAKCSDPRPEIPPAYGLWYRYGLFARYRDKDTFRERWKYSVGDYLGSKSGLASRTFRVGEDYLAHKCPISLSFTLSRGISLKLPYWTRHSTHLPWRTTL